MKLFKVECFEEERTVLIHAMAAKFAAFKVMEFFEGEDIDLFEAQEVDVTTPVDVESL